MIAGKKICQETKTNVAMEALALCGEGFGTTSLHSSIAVPKNISVREKRWSSTSPNTQHTSETLVGLATVVPEGTPFAPMSKLRATQKGRWKFVSPIDSKLWTIHW